MEGHSAFLPILCVLSKLDHAPDTPIPRTGKEADEAWGHVGAPSRVLVVQVPRDHNEDQEEEEEDDDDEEEEDEEDEENYENYYMEDEAHEEDGEDAKGNYLVSSTSTKYSPPNGICYFWARKEEERVWADQSSS